MNTILVAERFNTRDWLWAGAMARDDVERWLRVSQRLGAFRRGDGRRKLESVIGSLDSVVTMNLLPPCSTCGVWDASLASTIADVLWQHEYHRWILVGRRVARAFGEVIGAQAQLETHQYNDRTVLVVPHPSGLNCWQNQCPRIRDAAVQEADPKTEHRDRMVDRSQRTRA